MESLHKDGNSPSRVFCNTPIGEDRSFEIIYGRVKLVCIEENTKARDIAGKQGVEYKEIE